MKMRLFLFAGMVAAAGIVCVYATNSRVESMGKHDTFFMDDVSIFWNPANVNIYPNFLTGELGVYTMNANDTAAGGANRRYNRDPENPTFGGIYAHSLAQTREGGGLYPMFSVGLAFNRRDELVTMLHAASARLDSVNDTIGTVYAPAPLINADVFVGYTLINNVMLGGHLYVAWQDSGRVNSTSRSSVVKGDLGCNWPLSKTMDLEVALGMANVAFGIPGKPDPAHRDFSFSLRARLFSAMDALNGEVVPVLKLEKIKIRDYRRVEFGAGVGLNITVDRGFFWLGAEAYRSTIEDSIPDTLSLSGAYKQGMVTIPLGFGMERSIVWDWFIVRVGCQKRINLKNETTRGIEYTSIGVNPEGDGTVNDNVGMGIGINVEERLKFDITVAEDLPYTLGNLFSGPLHHILTRISATYSF